MSLTIGMVEELVAWCAGSEALASARSGARRQFLGCEEPGTEELLLGVGDAYPRERRFLGWFCFGFRLPDGRLPAELAAAALLTGPALVLALRCIKQARYVTVVTTMVKPGEGVRLRLEDEEFDIDSPILGHMLCMDDILCAHIVPDGQSSWLLRPGWLVWPGRFGRAVGFRIKTLQLDPVQMERLFQGNVKEGGRSGRHESWKRHQFQTESSEVGR